MMRNTERNVAVQTGIPVWALLKSLLLSYVVTACLLLLLALGLYRFGLGERVVSAAIIAIYVAATLLGGLFAGRKIQSRKFLWGLVVGITYFVVLVLMSLCMTRSVSVMGRDYLTTLALCGGGGMLGGMLG